MSMGRRTRLMLLTMTASFIGLAWFLSYSAVDNSLTAEDSRYTSLFLKNVTVLPENPSYLDELKFIESVQQSVLGIAPQTKKGAIPVNSLREPKNLYFSKTGYCYDRSRTIEKILRLHGFKVRHIFMVGNMENRSTIKSLMTPGVNSHAVTEVLTQKGWLIVGSNNGWLSLDKNNEPVSIKQLKYMVDNSIPLKLAGYSTETIYYKPFGYVYGMYSRHGRFYPPFNSIPDINYEEFIQNF